MKILCTGDLHLGRRSSRLPKHLDDRAHSAAGCWARIVDFALTEAVDVVVLSGDLVDRENRFYEAVGPLEAGLRRLAGAGITTVAVAGNHDFDVLPRLAGGFDPEAFHLLGRGGVWERVTVRRGEQVLHLDGWSFPAQYVRESPLASYSLPVPDSGPVLALLHADLEQPRSPYAPVALPELRARPVDFWLLGHIHTRYLHEAAGLAPVLYPGSPQALDPGESGAHGVWLLDLSAGRRFDLRFVPLSTVRYDEVVIDLTGAADLGEVDARVVEGVKSHLTMLEDDGVPRCLSCRLRVVGRTPVHRRLAAHLEALTPDLVLQDRGVTAVVEKAEIATRPAYDLAELARGNDPVGVLARLLVGLEGGGGAARGDGDGVPAALEAEPAGSVGNGFASPGLDAEQARLLRDAERAALEDGRARAYMGLSGRGEGDRYGARGHAAHAGPGAGGREGGGAGEFGDRPGESVSPGVAHGTLARQATLLLDTLLAQKEGA